MARLLEIAESVAALARKAGAKDARVKAHHERESVIEWRDGKVDRVRESEQRGLTVALYVDGRFTSGVTSDLRPEALERWLQDAVAAARVLAVDPHRHLPDPARYEGLCTRDLELVDKTTSSTSVDGLTARARELEEAARQSGADSVLSVTTSAAASEETSACVTTNGFAHELTTTAHSREVEVTVRGEGDRKPSGYAYGATRFVADLPVLELGPEARTRALAQVGSRQVATGRYDIIVENRAAPSLVRHLLQPLAASAVQQKRSFLAGRLGAQLGSPLLDLTDDPLLARGLASALWDPEGMASRSFPLFTRGVLQSYYVDTYYGSKLGLAPTSGAGTNVVWRPGTRDGAAMVKDLARGLFITRFLGGNSNATTGDFSLGVAGFWVEKGVPVHPVSEMNLAGSHLTLWKELVEVGSDPYRYSTQRTPTLRFAGMQASGRG